MAKKNEATVDVETKADEAINVTKDPRADWVEIPALYYDTERYSAPLFVGVNGKTYLIPRGVDGIKVPRAVKAILDQSAYQKQMAGRYMKSIEGTKNLGEF